MREAPGKPPREDGRGPSPPAAGVGIEDLATTASGLGPVSRRTMLAALALLVGVAVVLRVAYPGTSPPGLHVDEAYNIWNAHTLARTGQDQYGVRWPVFSTGGFGENRSALFLYLLAPFVAVGGPDVATARLGAGLLGALAVVIAFLLGRRWFGTWVGLAAAAILAANPWHLQLSRWAHEATVTPLLVLLSVALLGAAGIPPFGGSQQPRPARALVAGLVFGACCYGYPSVRIFLPALLVATALAARAHWKRTLAERRGRLATLALVAGLAVTLGPLALRHLSDPGINRRAALSLAWGPGDSIGSALWQVLARYPGHFGLDFLFLHGDTDLALSPPGGWGLFQWTLLPFMVAGAVALVRRRSSPAEATLLTWLLLYPLPDLAFSHPTPHALRAATGIPALVLLAAVGVVATVTALRRRLRPAAAAAVLLVLFAAESGLYLHRFFGRFNRELGKVRAFPADVLEACRWLRPRLPELDAVFISGQAPLAHPYIYSLVGLGYPPERWFADERELIQGPLLGGSYINEVTFRRYGKLTFLVDREAVERLNRLVSNGRADRVALIVRPGELSSDRLGRPAARLKWPDGTVSLLLYESTL